MPISLTLCLCSWLKLINILELGHYSANIYILFWQHAQIIYDAILVLVIVISIREDSLVMLIGAKQVWYGIGTCKCKTYHTFKYTCRLYCLVFPPHNFNHNHSLNQGFSTNWIYRILEIPLCITFIIAIILGRCPVCEWSWRNENDLQSNDTITNYILSERRCCTVGRGHATFWPLYWPLRAQHEPIVFVLQNV